MLIYFKSPDMFHQVSFLVGLDAIGEIRTQFAAEVSLALVTAEGRAASRCAERWMLCDRDA